MQVDGRDSSHKYAYVLNIKSAYLAPWLEQGPDAATSNGR